MALPVDENAPQMAANASSETSETSFSASSEPLRCWVPLLPPSMNQLYTIYRKGRSVQVQLRPEFRYFKGYVKQFIPAWRWKSQTPFGIKLYLSRDWYYKNGRILRLDLQNLAKATIDAICEKIGVDDCNCFHVEMEKLQTDRDALEGFGVELHAHHVRNAEEFVREGDWMVPAESKPTETY